MVGKLERTSNFSNYSMNPVWKKVWSLKVPAKIKIFTWTALKGVIPCKGILANRHIITSSLCPLCTMECESNDHALFQCPRVAEIWEHLRMRNAVMNSVS